VPAAQDLLTEIDPQNLSSKEIHRAALDVPVHPVLRNGFKASVFPIRGCFPLFHARSSADRFRFGFGFRLKTEACGLRPSPRFDPRQHGKGRMDEE